MRFLRTTCLGITLVTLAVAGCDDNPIDEDTDQAARIMVNPSFATIEAGETANIDAFTQNVYGDPTLDEINFVECADQPGDITVTDTVVSGADPGLRAQATGVTLGRTCLIAESGSLADTARIIVVPTGIQVTAPDTILSGTVEASQVTFLDANGNPVSGFDLEDVTLTTSDEGIIEVSAAGEVTAKAPGTATLSAELSEEFGAPRVGEFSITVVPGNFAGTLSPTAGPAGTEFTATFATEDPAFDSDALVTIADYPFSYPAFTTSGDELNSQVPVSLGAGNQEVVFTGLGEGQVALGAPFEVTAERANDEYEPNNVTDGTPPAPVAIPFRELALTDGTEGDVNDFYEFTLTEATSIEFFLDWNDEDGSGDLDFILRDPALEVVCFAASTAIPETTTCDLDPGTYLIQVNDFAAGPPTDYYFSAEVAPPEDA